MKTGQELFQERSARLTAAFNMETPDRIPIILGGAGFIKYGDPTATLADYFERREWADDITLKAYAMLEEIDSTPMVGSLLSAVAPGFFSKLKVPGRELPRDALWQIDEIGPMTEKDYDTVIDKGWNEFTHVLHNRLGYTPEEAMPDLGYMMTILGKQIEQGLVPCIGGMANNPFDTLSSARKIDKFFLDLRRYPEKVLAALEVITQDTIANLKDQLEVVQPMSVFYGGARCGCDMLSLKMFEKFAWPYFKRVADAVIESGVKVLFHMDSRWDDNLPYFKEFPKGTCIFDPDSMTDIYKIKEVLGDRMCITGDVSPSLLCLGTPDEVYAYAKKLTKDFGPSGFVMSSGCAVPPNTPLENIKAVIAATLEN
jgi:hypothetical protein